MNRLFEKAGRMLRDNHRRRNLLGVAAAAGAAIAVACAALLVYPAHALTGGDALRNAIDDDSAVFWRPAGAGDDAWGRTDGGSALDATSELRLRVAFRLPAGTLADGATLQYRLPSSVRPDTSAGPVEGDVYASPTVADASRTDARAIGSYSLDSDVLTLTFNDDVATANAGGAATGDKDASQDGAAASGSAVASGSAAASGAVDSTPASDLSGYLDLDLGFDELACDGDGLAKIELNDAVTLRVAKAAAAANAGSVDQASSQDGGQATAGEAASAQVSATTAQAESGDAGGAVASLAAARPFSARAAAASGTGKDLTPYITGPVSVTKKSGNNWVGVPDGVLTDGDEVKVHIDFIITPDAFVGGNKTVRYTVPDGLRPKEHLHGELPKNYGTYDIGTDGTIALEFYDEAVADGGALPGDVEFKGTAIYSGDGEPTKIDFGGKGGTITVKKGESGGGDDDKAHDIKVEKTATKSADDSKISYTVTVSTEKGTPSTVDISDRLDRWNSSNATPAYEKGTLELKRVFSNGGWQMLGTSATWNDNGNDGPTFSLSGLPQLSAGEKYVLTYTVDTKKQSDGADATVANQASATSGDKNDGSYQRVSFEQDAKKWGSYDAKTDHIVWTIEVNPNGKDVSSWTVYDNLTEGTTLTQQYVVRSEDGSVKKYFGNVGESTVNFNFSKLGTLTDAQKTQKYFIDIYTDAPSSDGQVENKSTTWTKTSMVDSTGTVDVRHRTTEVSKQHRTDAAADERGKGVRKETWSPTITLPGGNLSSFTYEDTLDATDGNGVSLADGHYAIAAELDKVFQSSVQNAGVDATTGLFLNVDGYSKYLYRGNGKAYYDDYWPAQDGSKHDVSFTVTYYDAKGNEVAATDTTTHVTRFTVEVDVDEGAKVKAIDMRTGEYPTYLDTTKVGEGASITATNKGKVGNAASKPTFTYTRPHRILKAVKTGTNASAAGSHTFDFSDVEKNGGTLTYRVSLTTEQSDEGDLVVTDTLPKGMTYVDGSVRAAFFQDEWYESTTNGKGTDLGGANAPVLKTSTTEDGRTKLEVTIPKYSFDAGKPTVAVYYDVSIKSDPYWSTASSGDTAKKTYENTATWGTSTSTHSTEVDRTFEKVSKSGEQIYRNGQPTNDLRYYVEVNPAAQDLDPNSNVLTLTDKLDTGGIESDLDPSSVKLYAYDYSKEHNYDPSRPIEGYMVNYDSKTHTMSVTVPDGVACVLTYDYTLDNTYVDGAQVNNSASLNGKYSKSGSISLKEASGGASVHKARLVLYKVDASDISKTLSGVKFRLSYWDGGKWVDKDTKDPLVTSEQGSITYDLGLNQDGLERNTLYRLSEVDGTAPAGYAGGAEHFFIVKAVTGGTTISDDAAFSAANATGATNKSGGTLTAADVDFFKDNKTSTMYVKNEYTRLTAKKSWADENGVAKDAPAGASAKFALYRYTKKVDGDNSVNVTVTAKGNQSWSNETKLTGDRVSDGTVAVRKGSDFTFSVSGLWSGCSFDVYVGEQKYGETHTFASDAPVSVTVSNVTANTTIEVKQNVGNDVRLFEDTNKPWVEPPQILDDTTGVKVGEAEVSASSGWAANWDDLPKQVGGKDVYYAVKELSYTVNGKVCDAGTGSYDVSYVNDDGIQTGTITVTNSEKKNQGYELPSTGGTPSPLPWVGATLATLAVVLLARRMRPRRG